MNSCLRCLALIGISIGVAGCPSRSNTVFGIVTDAAGAPLCGALVVLDGEGETHQTHTGENGDFRFEFIDPGDHSVQVVGAIGYAPSEAIPVTIEEPNSGGSRPPNLAFSLVPGESAGGEICEPDNGGCTGAKGSLGRELSRLLGDRLTRGMIVVPLPGLNTIFQWNGE